MLLEYFHEKLDDLESQAVLADVVEHFEDARNFYLLSRLDVHLTLFRTRVIGALAVGYAAVHHLLWGHRHVAFTKRPAHLLAFVLHQSRLFDCQLDLVDVQLHLRIHLNLGLGAGFKRPDPRVAAYLGGLREWQHFGHLLLPDHHFVIRVQEPILSFAPLPLLKIGVWPHIFVAYESEEKRALCGALHRNP